jgi:predicted O-methyltransferase YrrM
MARGAIDLPEKLAEYVVAMGVRETAVQRRLRAATRGIPFGTMQIGPEQAALMQLLVRLTGARRCIEIGTFTAIRRSRGARPAAGRRIVGCDLSEGWTAVARRYWKLAGVEKKISLRLAPALDTLRTLKGKFDFAFIDADKTNCPNDYDVA